MSNSYIISLLRSGFGVLTSRVFGLIRDIVIAAVYGATGVTDIFFVAFAIPNLFRQFFAEGAISSAFLPFLSDKTHHHGTKAANAYLTQLIMVQAILVTIVSILLMIFAKYVIIAFVPGMADDHETIAIGTVILRIVMPYLFFVSVSGLLSGFLNLHSSYFVAYASTSCLNLMMISGAIIGYYHQSNIYSLALSAFAGGAFQLVVVYIYAFYKGFRFGSLAPQDPDIKKTYALLIPSLAGVGISQLNFLIGRLLASFLQSGSISWLFYANRLFQFPLGIFAVTISTVGLTELSKARSSGDMDTVKRIIDKSIIMLLFLMLPATIGLVGLAEEIIQLIFGRNAFSPTDIVNTASALQMYSIGLMFYSLTSVFTRIYHSEKNTKKPVKIAAVAFLVNVICTFFLMKPLAHTGIALASSIAAVVNALLLYMGIRGYSFSIRQHLKLLVKIMVALYVMLLFLVLGKIFHAPVLVTISVCVLAYFGALFLMKVRIKELFR